MQLTGKHILVVGADGYIGSALAARLSQEKCTITLCDQTVPSLPRKPYRAIIHRRTGDVAHRTVWQRILPEIDVVFHLAAIESKDLNRDLEQEWRVNAGSVVQLLEACRQGKHQPRIIFSSSANIFGLTKKLPVNEKTPSHPAAVWSAHKLLAEQYLRVYAADYAIPSISLRLANVYGPSQDFARSNSVVLNKVMHSALGQHHLTLYSNKDCIRDFIFLDDVVEAFIGAAQQDASWDGQFWVIGSGEGKSFTEIWHFLARRIKRKTGQTVTIHEDFTVVLDGKEKRNFIADSRGFKKLTGWKPQVRLWAGIDRTLERQAL